MLELVSFCGRKFCGSLNHQVIRR